MERRTASGLMLTLLLTSMLTLAFSIPPVRAEPTTWTVDDDGPADFHTIQEAIDSANWGDTVYVKAGTYYENVVVGKTLSLIGEGSRTVVIDGNYELAVQVAANNVAISGFTIRHGLNGIRLLGFSNSIISNNITDNTVGVYLYYYCSSNMIVNNDITDNYYGVELDYSSGNTIYGNNITGNGSYGISSVYSSYNNISSNKITNNSVGVSLSQGSGNSLYDNRITNNDWGIKLYGSSSNTIAENNITANNYNGIETAGYHSLGNNIISQNSVTANNWYGILLYGDYNAVYENEVTANKYGIGVAYASYNTISGNDIAANTDCGINLLWDSSGNIIFHNDFIDNTVQVKVEQLGYGNAWDDGYPSGGNYWSDYSGLDLYYGPDQDVPSRDGIGDTPYIIDSNNQDRYPLTDPWIERKVGVNVGDWVKYGDFVVEWSSDDPSANPPSDYDFWRSIEWTKTMVEAIVGTTITFEFLIHLKNGTEQSSIWDIDVDTGAGFPFYFISADLAAGYTTYAGGIGYSPGPEINETISVEYLGTSRETNHLNLSRFYEDYFGWRNYWESYNFCWDRPTGVQTEYSYQRSFETGTEAYQTAELTSFRIVGTSLWGVGWVERKPGVKAGDWTKYGDYVVEWSSNDPGQHPPTDIQDWMNVTVQNTVGTNITFQLVMHYKTSPEYTTIGWQDVSTSDGRGQMGLPLFISANLSAGDTLYQTVFPVPINETISREYVRAIREVNHVAFEWAFIYISPDKYFNTSLSGYWDRATGILTEYMVENVFVDENMNYETSTTISFRIVETNLWEAPTPPAIIASLDSDPDDLNLGSNGKWITAYIQLPKGYNASDIDATTILLNGTVAPVLDLKYGFVKDPSGYLIDHDNDGILERMVKFDRTAVESFIYNQGIRCGNVALIMTGALFDETQFEGTDIIYVDYAGDANGDKEINIFDVLAVKSRWKITPDSPNWVPECDVNRDQAISIFDLLTVKSNWGQRTP